MRQHGVPDFPDPKRAPEGGLSNVDSGYRIIDYRGVLLEPPGHDQHAVPGVQAGGSHLRCPFLVL